MKAKFFLLALVLMLCIGSEMILRGDGLGLIFVGAPLVAISSLVVSMWILPPLLCASKAAIKYSIPASIPIFLLGIVLIMLSGRAPLFTLLGVYSIYAGGFGLSGAGFIVNSTRQDFCQSLYTSGDKSE